MEKIASFKINHTKLQRGIYVSRKDKIEGGGTITTFDIRMKLPNREPAVSQSALHTIEHLAATFLRNHPVWGKKIVYWGPMGCCTGNYLLIQGDLNSSDIVPLMKETFTFIADFNDDIPGANAHDCGNYMLNNLPMAKWEARKFLVEVLDNLTEANLNYPED
jgi:S-ribosylhomocysteine lyase